MSKPDSAKCSSKTPAAKKLKLETSDDEPSSSRTPSVDSGILASVELKRKQCAGNILEFKFNKKRCRLLSKSMDLGNFGGGVLYWMSREQRVQGIISVKTQKQTLKIFNSTIYKFLF